MPAATPHVGQGTENNCFAVRLLVLIWIGCDKTSRRTVPFGTLCAPAIENCRSYRTFVGDKASHRLMDPMPRSTAFVGNARLILGDSQPTRKTPQQAPGLLVGLGLFAARSLRQGIPTAKMLPKVSQEMLAEIIGTARSRVNFFMNKFRKLNFIHYNGELQVHNSLLSVTLHD